MIINVIKNGKNLIAILYCETCGKPFHHKLPKYHSLECYGRSLEKKVKNEKAKDDKKENGQ